MDSSKKKILTKLFNIKNLIIFLCSLFFGILVVVLFCLFRGGFNLLNSNDGSFVAAAILIGFGCFHISANVGTFDVITVGFINLFSSFKKNGTKKYDGIYEYQTVKEKSRSGKRFYFFPLISAGIVYLLIAIILFFLYKASL